MYVDIFAQVAYQNILQLSYVDKLLTDIQREFRERYNTSLLNLKNAGSDRLLFDDFTEIYNFWLRKREEESRSEKKSGR